MSPKSSETKISPLAPDSFPAMPVVPGVLLSSGACGLKKSGQSDLMFVELANGATVAGVFTQSLTASAPVQWSRKALRGGLARGLVVNSGGANVFTGPTVLTAVAILGSMGFLALALRTLPMGTAYAVWTGIGTIGTVALGILLFNEPSDALRLACIGLILAGIVGLKLVSGH